MPLSSVNIGNIIISSGGTIVPIDKMRVLTNKSAGSTGAILAEKMIGAGHPVTYVGTGKSVLPYIHPFQLNPIGQHPGEAREMLAALQGQIIAGVLTLIDTPYFDDYQREMVRVASESKIGDVAIIAAAVSDYGMKQVVDGKISSDQEDLSLELAKLPKIINLMRQASESLVMIGFKLLPEEASPDSTRDKLIAAAIKQMDGPSQTDLVVANASGAKVGNPRLNIQTTFLVSPDGSYQKIERQHLGDALRERMPDLIERRASLSAEA